MTLSTSWAFVALLSAAPPSAAAGEALVISAGSIARQQVVAVGRDLLVAGDAQSDVAAIDGSAEITGSVAGDVIVMSGSAILRSTARVGGDVFVLGGELRAEPGAAISGRAVSYPTVSAAWLTLLEGPSLGLSARSPLVVGAKLALLAAWAAVLLVLFAASGREMLATSEAIRRQPLRSFLVGLTAVATMALTTLFLLALSAALVGLPLLVLVVVVALLFKLWGMTAVFHAFGAWLFGRFPRRRAAPLHAACAGLLALGILKFFPWVGVVSWTAATLLGIGATVMTKFGRGGPWFSADPAPREILTH